MWELCSCVDNRLASLQGQVQPTGETMIYGADHRIIKQPYNRRKSANFCFIGLLNPKGYTVGIGTLNIKLNCKLEWLLTCDLKVNNIH
jgi:hypothetical protein